MSDQHIKLVSGGVHSDDPDSAALWPQDANGLSNTGMALGVQPWPMMSAFAPAGVVTSALEAVASVRPLAANDYTFSYSGAIVTFTVPVTGTYDITAFGGDGDGYSSRTPGGLGAEIGSDIFLSAGTRLEILVGQSGYSSGGGGGGGSFIVEETTSGLTPLVIAGGGGGGGRNNAGFSGNIATSGLAGSGSGAGAGGTDGGGGGMGNNDNGGGGGYLGEGGGVGDQGLSFMQGGNGGGDDGYGGGFGGGGSTLNSTGGGGGGYSGGGGGGSLGGGGGGGSYATGTLQVAMSFGPDGYSDDGSVTIDLVCFLAGTHILTPNGEVTVETLKVGDLVVTAAGEAAPLTWIGHRDVAATASGHDDMHRPVRIRASAFAPDVPHRDLLVTPEHCVFTDGVLIPARMLVNGRSIISDDSIGAYSFFHLELAEHSILLSEGLTTESYLDTGNRALFADGQTSTGHRGDQIFMAPLAVDRETVEPIWQRLDARATGLGLALAVPEIEFTTDPALRVLLDNGRELTARWLDQARYLFHIPRGARPIRLLSRASTPASVIGPFCDDRRRLGIAIERLALWNGLDERVVEAAALPEDGWHGVEGTRRWSNGSAALNFAEAQETDTFLDVTVMATMPYAVQPQIGA